MTALPEMEWDTTIIIKFTHDWIPDLTSDMNKTSYEAVRGHSAPKTKTTQVLQS